MNIKLLSIYICLAFSLSGFSQKTEKKVAKAGDDYENYGYINAISIYEDVLKSGFSSEEMLKRLANAYYFNAKYDKAQHYYAELFNTSENLEAKYKLRYAQSLRAVGMNNEADAYFSEYQNASTDEVVSTIDYASLIAENSGRYTINVLKSLNTNGIEFGHTVQNNHLFFATTKDTGTVIKRISGWEGLGFLELYQAPIGADDHTGKAKRVFKKRSKYHQSSATFTKDGETMFFTKSNATDNDKNPNLHIYRATFEDDSWSEPHDLSINSDVFSNANPALDPSGKILYFSSDRPGGYGDSDLYSVTVNNDGSLGKPKNLGSKINTTGKETFPFVSKDNELYFSSDGHWGLGGMDVFCIKSGEGELNHVLNVGAPINSYADDFSFGINTDTKKGFFSSNRTENGESFIYADIYQLEENTLINDYLSTRLYGKVTAKNTDKPLANAHILLLDKNNKPLDTVTTSASGNYEVMVERFEQYSVRAIKEKYDTEEKRIVTNEPEQELNFQLQQNTFAMARGKDLAKMLEIKTIYFDFDKAEITSKASVQLEKVIAVMRKYPQIKIDIQAHTDSRGNDAYNLKLSKKRAKATLDYIVGKGIASKRLAAEGLGESMLVNACSNGVPCSSQEHKSNRRSEFLIVN